MTRRHRRPRDAVIEGRPGSRWGFDRGAGDVEPASARSSAVESVARPARSATILASSRTWSSGRSSRQQRQPDPLAANVGEADVGVNRPSSKNGAENPARRSVR